MRHFHGLSAKPLLLITLHIVIATSISPQEPEPGKVISTKNGTTTIHTYGEHGKLLTEEIILYSGRYKITHFDDEGNPQYGVIKTATGAVGLMYYDREAAPLFKFWDYGNDDTIVQFYNEDLESLAKIRIETMDGARNIRWLNAPEKKNSTVLTFLFICTSIVVALGIAIAILRRRR